MSVLRQQSRNARGNVVTRARRMSSLLKANRRRCHRGNITTMTKGKLLPSDGPVREWEHETCRVMTPSWVPEAKKYPIGLSPIPASRSSDRGTSALEKRLWSAGWRKWARNSSGGTRQVRPRDRDSVREARPGTGRASDSLVACFQSQKRFV